MAFTSANYINIFNPDHPRYPLRFVGIENFIRLFNDLGFTYSIYKTLLFVATSVPLKLALGVTLAFLFTSPHIWGKKVMRGLTLTPWALPVVMTIMVWRGLFDPSSGPMAQILGNIIGRDFTIYRHEWDAFLAYNIVEMWLAYPFIMTVVLGAISGVSKELIEASLIDGAGIMARFRKIILPQISRPLWFATILTSGASLQAFMVPLLLNDGGPIQLVRGEAFVRTNDLLMLFGYHKAFMDGEYGYAAAFYLIVVIIIAVYMLIWFKISGMYRGVGE
jgi:arabinogalactan oligomer/maltooligosaccharide transport system permease protein